MVFLCCCCSYDHIQRHIHNIFLCSPNSARRLRGCFWRWTIQSCCFCWSRPTLWLPKSMKLWRCSRSRMPKYQGKMLFIPITYLLRLQSTETLTSIDTSCVRAGLMGVSCSEREGFLISFMSKLTRVCVVSLLGLFCFSLKHGMH